MLASRLIFAISLYHDAFSLIFIESSCVIFLLSAMIKTMAKITALDTATSSFFSHQDPAMVEWFVKMVEERKKQQDSSKEKKAW